MISIKEIERILNSSTSQIYHIWKKILLLPFKFHILFATLTAALNSKLVSWLTCNPFSTILDKLLKNINLSWPYWAEKFLSVFKIKFKFPTITYRTIRDLTVFNATTLSLSYLLHNPNSTLHPWNLTSFLDIPSTWKFFFKWTFFSLISTHVLILRLNVTPFLKLSWKKNLR